MSKKTKQILDPTEIKKLAKKIISENPIYMPDEPTRVGSPENFTEEQEEENEQSNTKKSKRSKE